MRWDCHNCTLCCRLFSLGPVDPVTIAGLQARDVGADWAPAADGWFHETPDGLFLNHVDDSCVFLRPDGLCAVHALYGPDAKPAFCRTFPFTRVAQAGGVVHALREDCGGGWQAQATGTPAEQHVAHLPEDAPVLHFGDAPVQVLPGVGVAAADWLALEDHLVAAIDPTADPRDNLRALRRRLLGALGRDAPAPSAAVADGSTEQLRQAFLAALAQVGTPAGDARYAERFMARVHRGLIQAVPTPATPLSAESRVYVAQVWREHLRGKGFQAVGGVCWGLGLQALGVELARARARSGALADLAPWHVLWSRFTRNQAARSLLHQRRSLLWDAALHR